MIKFGKTIFDAAVATARNEDLSKVGAKFADSASKTRTGRSAMWTGRKGRAAAGSTAGKALFGAAVAVNLGQNFVSSVDNNRQVSDPLYELTMGSSNFDEHVFGKQVGAGALMMPYTSGQLIGNGLKNVALRNASHTNLRSNSILTRQTFTDAARANRTNSRSSSAPIVDGSIAFGMYNSRLG